MKRPLTLKITGEAQFVERALIGLYKILWKKKSSFSKIIYFFNSLSTFFLNIIVVKLIVIDVSYHQIKTTKCFFCGGNQL